jgi:hypothetical protein
MSAKVIERSSIYELGASQPHQYGLRVSLYGRPQQQPALVRGEIGACVAGVAVVPDDEVARAPHVRIDELRLFAVVKKEVEKLIAFLPRAVGGCAIVGSKRSLFLYDAGCANHIAPASVSCLMKVTASAFHEGVPLGGAHVHATQNFRIPFCCRKVIAHSDSEMQDAFGFNGVRR